MMNGFRKLHCTGIGDSGQEMRGTVFLPRLDVPGFDACAYTAEYDVNGMGARFCACAAVEMLGRLALCKLEK
jgi:hypothetical protein